MANRKVGESISKSEPTRRVTISIPESFLFALEKIALRSKSSVAWVVRSALDKYLKDENDKQQN
jgi:metal-responsive CopG/Arc/MetJ family transcriptional regulator